MLLTELLRLSDVFLDFISTCLVCLLADSCGILLVQIDQLVAGSFMVTQQTAVEVVHGSCSVFSIEGLFHFPDMPGTTAVKAMQIGMWINGPGLRISLKRVQRSQEVPVRQGWPDVLSLSENILLGMAFRLPGM